MRVERAVDAVRRCAAPLDSSSGLGRLMEAIGEAEVVLIGEASHGTDEFYRLCADLTAALITSKAFDILAVEADWPDAYRANRWVRLSSDDVDAAGALDDFTRFPRWMWRNDVVVDFFAWLREFNRDRTAGTRIGFYGLDLYSPHTSMDAVLRYLRSVDRDTHMMETLEARRQVRPSLDGSYERLSHEVAMPQFLVPLHEEPARSALLKPRLERWSVEEADLPETFPVGV